MIEKIVSFFVRGGIIIIGIFMIIFSLLGFMGANLNSSPSEGLANGLTNLYLIACLIFGIQIFRLKNWARIGTIICSNIGMLFCLWVFFKEKYYLFFSNQRTELLSDGSALLDFRFLTALTVCFFFIGFFLIIKKTRSLFY